MGTFFKEQLHLKEPFQTYRSLTPLQHTTRTDRMKFLLPILLISLAALCNIQPAQGQALEDDIDYEQALPLELIELDEELPDGMARGVDDETVQLRLGMHQRIAAKKAAKFFRDADTNRTGALTWNEYWNAVHKILHQKGYSHATIMKYKHAFHKRFNHAARGGLIRWKDVIREIKVHVRH